MTSTSAFKIPESVHTHSVPLPGRLESRLIASVGRVFPAAITVVAGITTPTSVAR